MNTWIDRCSAHLNILVRTKPLESYHLKYCKDRKLWTFFLFIEGTTQFFQYSLAWYEMLGPTDYEIFKERLKVYFP